MTAKILKSLLLIATIAILFSCNQRSSGPYSLLYRLEFVDENNKPVDKIELGAGETKDIKLSIGIHGDRKITSLDKNSFSLSLISDESIGEYSDAFDINKSSQSISANHPGVSAKLKAVLVVNSEVDLFKTIPVYIKGEQSAEVLDNAATLSSAVPFYLCTRNNQKNWEGSLEYSLDNNTWTLWDGGEVFANIRSVGVDDSAERYYIYLRGQGNTYITGSPVKYGKEFVLRTIDNSNDIIVNGDFRNLLNYQNPSNANMAAGCFSYLFYSNIVKGNPDYGISPIYKIGEEFALPTTLSSRCFDSMFMGCINLVNAPKLPATTLKNKCYNQMFENCSSLTVAPNLPAIIMGDYCYERMFYGCSKLATAPELASTSLALGCYSFMFANCSALTSTTSLPATTMASQAYMGMFLGCKNLLNSPTLPSHDIKPYCYSRMFEDCTSLTLPPALPAESLDLGCYANMFKGCSSLSAIPYLPAYSLATMCYNGMFEGCGLFDFAQTRSAEYYNELVIGENGDSDGALNAMFENTCQLFKTIQPQPNSKYYAKNPVIK